MRSCLLEKKLGTQTDFRIEKGDGFGFLSTSTSPVAQRVAQLKPKKKIGRSPSQRKTVSRKERANGFACENESPPSKIQRISSQTNMKIESPNQKHSSYKERRPASSGLMAACNELVNLAVTRGSWDDITVMIIDLNHFRWNSISSNQWYKIYSFICVHSSFHSSYCLLLPTHMLSFPTCSHFLEGKYRG